jgi:hypothetical protein
MAWVVAHEPKTMAKPMSESPNRTSVEQAATVAQGQALVKQPTETERKVTMRKTYYMGRECGAQAVEMRRGTISYISLGSVERPPAAEQAIGAPGWRFRPSCQLKGKPAKALADRLSSISIAYGCGEITAEQRLDATDRAIRAEG